jgi:D-aminoacyl-tRNA deacylase
MEKIAIVSSLEDKASKNIASQLKEIGVPAWATYYEFKEDTINLPLDKVKEEKIIVLSQHASKAGKKSFTSHSIGNFSKADFGGEESKLVQSLPKIQTNFLRNFYKIKEEKGMDEFDICYEVTHHGPYTNKKVVFVELGSSEEEWLNKDYARIVAETVLDSTLELNGDKVVIGLGGGHYAPDFTKLALRKNYSFGHICPQYMLDALDKKLLEQMISKTGAEEIILDWKGLKKWKEKVLDLCENSGLEYERVQRLLK